LLLHYISIPCIWFIFISKEYFGDLILIADPAERGACFTTETNAWMFAWQQLLTWFIAGLLVTELKTQLSATTVAACPVTRFLQHMTTLEG
jgi:hypothetical protein